MRRLYPRARTARLVAALCVALSGCSLVDPGSDSLAFETLVQSDSFVTKVPSRFSGNPVSIGPLVILRSDADEAAFRTLFGAGPLPTPVDYSRETVVGMVFESSVEGSRIALERIDLDGDTFDFTIRAEGDFLVDGGESVVSYPAHLVRVRRLSGTFSGFMAQYTYPPR